MSCNLNNIKLNNCNPLSVGGLQSIYLFPFGDIYDYTYDDNDTNYITNYRQLSMGIEVEVNRNSSNFSETMIRDTIYHFNQQLNCSITKLDDTKRGGLKALFEYPLTAIVKDKNGLCWILGEKSPLKLDVYTATSGVSDGTSEYQIQLQGLHREQIKRIRCIDGFCGASVNATYLNNSYFTIDNFLSTYIDGGDFEIQVNNFTLDGNLRPFEPLLWSSDPNIYQRDLTLLQSIVGTYGTVEDLSYDMLLDELTFTISSTLNVFPLLSLENIQFQSDISQFVNITIVGGVNQLGSVITLNDEAGLLYSAPYGDDITTGPDLYGVSNNSYINLNNYSGGQTFTIQTNGSCGLTELEVVVPEFTNCLTEFSVTTQDSYSYSFEYRKSDCDFDYTYTQLYFNGITSVLFPTLPEWHNDFQLFKDEVERALIETNYVDVSTLTFTDSPTVVLVEFNAYINNADLFVFNWRGDVSTNKDYQKTIGIFNTFANSDSFISVSSVRGSYDGYYGQPIDNITNLYNVLEAPNLTNNTNNLGLELDVFGENDEYNALIKSVQCPDSSYNFKTLTCLDDIVREYVGVYKRFVFELTELNKTFRLGTNAGDYFLFCSNPITPTNLKDFGIAIEQQYPTLFKLLNIQYNWFKEQFHIELLELDSNVTINEIETDFGNTIPTDNLDVYNYRTEPVLHPNILINWSFPTNCANWVYSQDAAKNPLEDYKWESTAIANFINNVGGSNLFEVNLRSNTVTQNGFTIRFHVGYPTTSNIVDTLVIPTPDLVGSIDIQSNPDYLNITHISFSMGSGMCLIVEWNSTMSNINIDAIHRFPLRSYWGFYKDFFVLAEKGFEHRAFAEITSLACPTYRPDATYWFNPRLANVNNTNTIASVESLRVIKGSKIARYSGNDIKIGDILVIDNTDNYYLVINVSGPNVELHARYRGTSNNSATFSYIYFSTLPNAILGSTTDAIINSPSEAPTFVSKAVGNGFGIRLSDVQYYAFTSNFTPTLIFATSINIQSVNALETIFAQTVNVLGNNGSEKLYVDGTTSEIYSYIEDDNGTSDSIIDSYTQAENIVVLSFNESTNLITLSINGVENVKTATLTTFNNLVNAILGADYDGLNIVNGFQGYISEFIIDEDNTFEKRRIYEGYLAWNCGLQNLLPFNHPYKNEAPNYNNI